MLKKTITFDDLDGNPVTEDFYFRLNKAEIAELELSSEGGLQGQLKEIIEAKDGKAIIEKFKEIIRMSVGRRSEDGRRFIKNDEIADEFMQTNAYSELFIELVSDADAAANFIKGIIPSDVRDQVDQGGKITDLETIQPAWPDAEETKDEGEEPAWITEDREPTQKELQSMSKEQLQEAFAKRQTRARE